MCFFHAACQWFLWLLVVKLLAAGRIPRRPHLSFDSTSTGAIRGLDVGIGLFDFYICCLDRINLGNNNCFVFLILGAGSGRAKGFGRAKDSGQAKGSGLAIGSMQNKLSKVVCHESTLVR